MKVHVDCFKNGALSMPFNKIYLVYKDGFMADGDYEMISKTNTNSIVYKSSDKPGYTDFYDVEFAAYLYDSSYYDNYPNIWLSIEYGAVIAHCGKNYYLVVWFCFL